MTVDCVASMHAHSAWPMLANPTVSSGAAAQQCCFCHCIGPRRVGFLGCASACLRCARCAVLLLHVVAERGRARADGARRAAAARAGERDPLGPAASIPLGTVATWLAGRARSVARWSRIAEYQYAAVTLCDAGRRDGLLHPRRRLASRRRAGDSPPRFLGLGWPRRPALVGCAAVQNRDFLCPMSSLPVTTGMRLLFLSICLSDVVQRQGPSRVSILNPRNPPSDPLRGTAAPCLPSDESDTAPRAPSIASGPFHATC